MRKQILKKLSALAAIYLAVSFVFVNIPHVCGLVLNQDAEAAEMEANNYASTDYCHETSKTPQAQANKHDSSGIVLPCCLEKNEPGSAKTVETDTLFKVFSTAATISYSIFTPSLIQPLYGQQRVVPPDRLALKSIILRI
ncbi:hypothetical protein HGA64_01120 [Candidatus Falkowbacteria bacterium]|nr:hypothetical protein [Candidatus Falkowbacteria bacterium]